MIKDDFLPKLAKALGCNYENYMNHIWNCHPLEQERQLHKISERKRKKQQDVAPGTHLCPNAHCQVTCIEEMLNGFINGGTAQQNLQRTYSIVMFLRASESHVGNLSRLPTTILFWVTPLMKLVLIPWSILGIPTSTSIMFIIRLNRSAQIYLRVVSIQQQAHLVGEAPSSISKS